MFGVTTLIRDEIGEDYTLKIISDVNNDDMTIVSITSLCTPSYLHTTAENSSRTNSLASSITVGGVA